MIPQKILHWRFRSLQPNSIEIRTSNHWNKTFRHSTYTMYLIAFTQIHCKLLDAANSCRWSRSIRRIPGRSSLGSSSEYWKLWALLVSVIVCSAQVATFFILSNLGLVHSVLDTTRLPSAYAPLHSWIWNEHWMGIFWVNGPRIPMPYISWHQVYAAASFVK